MQADNILQVQSCSQSENTLLLPTDYEYIFFSSYADVWAPLDSSAFSKNTWRTKQKLNENLSRFYITTINIHYK